MRRGLFAAVMLLGACAAQPTPKPVPQINPPPPVAPPPPPAPVAAAPAPKDSCGASDLQYLVGKPRTDIPVPLLPSLRRVVCTTCPITQEVNPARQTILFDAQSGLVSSVKCG